MRAILFGLIIAAATGASVPACPSAQSSNCIAGVDSQYSWMSVQCGPISYDATIPSGETFARKIAAIYYPTSLGPSNGVSPAMVQNPGSGWDQTASPFYTITCNFAAYIVQQGVVVYSLQTTRSASYQINHSGGYSSGVTSITVAPNATNGPGSFWPNLATCSICGLPLGGGIPIIIGAQTPNQEECDLTRQDSSGLELTLSCAGNGGATIHEHADGEYVDIPQTQFPASENDYQSWFRWCAENCGRGIYPGNPRKIVLSGTSSDSNNALLAAMWGHGRNAVRCSNRFFWWNSRYQFGLRVPCGTSNRSSAYTIVSAAQVSVVVDIATASQTSTGGSAIRSHWGCNYSDDGCEAFYSLGSPDHYAPPAFPFATLEGSLDTHIVNPSVACPLWPGANPCTIVPGYGHGVDMNSDTPASPGIAFPFIASHTLIN